MVVVLPAPFGSYEPHDFTGVDLEGDVPHCLRFTVALGYVLDLDHGVLVAGWYSKDVRTQVHTRGRVIIQL